MSDELNDIQQAIKKAEDDGFDIVLGDNYHLLLDLDTAWNMERYKELAPMANRLFGANELERWESKSGIGHWHVLMRLDDPLEPAQRLAVEAALGSDPRRTMLGIKRLVNFPDNEPGVLFKPPHSQSIKPKTTIEEDWL